MVTSQKKKKKGSEVVLSLLVKLRPMSLPVRGNSG